MRNPLDPFSEVVDERRHWDTEWYSWLQEIARVTTRLEISVPPETDLSGIEADIATLQTQTATLQSQVAVLEAQVAAIPAPGLVFIQSQTVTSPVASVDFTGLTSEYDVYVFEGDGIRLSSDDSIVFQISLDGGTSYVASGYYTDIVYHYAGLGEAAPAGSVHSNFPVSYLTHAVTYSSGSEYNTGFTFKLYAPPGVLFPLYRVESGNFNSSLGLMTWTSIGFNLPFVTAPNAVRFLVGAGGNIISGTITLYGMRKT